MKPYIVGSIFARGGSKGIPQKNIKLLGGRPLISYAIDMGLSSPFIERLIVSTDDVDIADIARKNGADVPFIRPKELATDTVPELHAWQHAVQEIQLQEKRSVDYLVVIPTTAPLRRVEDVNLCIQTIIESDADVVVTVKNASRSPYFNMLQYNSDGYMERVIKTHDIANRQETPIVYDMTTVAYVVKTSYLLQTSLILHGKVKAVLIPEERALDIDTHLDFEIAEFLMMQQKVNNEVIAKACRLE